MPFGKIPKKLIQPEYVRKRKPKVATQVYVKKMIDRAIEDKYYYVYPAATFTSITNTPWVELNIFAPAQNDGISGRTGSTVSIKSIEIRMIFQTGADELATDDSFNVIRLIFAQYTGATNTPLQTAGATINDPINRAIVTQGHLVRKYMDRFVTLQVTSTEKGAGDGYTPQIKQLKYFKRFKKPLRVTYGDNTTTLPSRRFILSMISDSIATTHSGVINGYILTTYEDA